MAKNLLAVADALDRAKGVNDGLDAVISLLFSVNESDMPSGRALGEVLSSLQQDMGRHLASAESGLRDSK